jgi:hypothetical protein
VPLLIIPVLVVLAIVVLIPMGIIRRYQIGTSRQRARRWVAMVNIAGLTLSTFLFAIAAVVTAIWVPDVVHYTAAGLGGGAVLGLTGLWLTKWEPGLDHLHYTPNRLLVLAITLTVTARVLYGFWRSYESWRAGLSGGSWFVAAGVPGSMAAGAVVLGYYLVFWLGVRRRLRRHDSRRLRKL